MGTIDGEKAALLAMGLAWSGCDMVSLVSSPVEKRGFGGFWSDSCLRAQINAAFLREGFAFQRIELMIHQGRVVMLGGVESEEMRRRAVAIVRGMSGVGEVIDAMEIGASSLSTYAKDTELSQRLKTALMWKFKAQALNYHVKVVNRVAYILGTASSPKELHDVILEAESFAVRRVVSYVTLKGALAS